MSILPLPPFGTACVMVAAVLFTFPPPLLAGLGKSAVWLTRKNLHSLGLNNFTRIHPKNLRYNETTTLRVAVEQWIPHVEVTAYLDGSFRIRGPLANLLDLLASTLNFNYTLVRPPDGAWGAPNSDGDWNGMLGMIQRNEVDLALGPFGLTESRAKVAQFSQPIMIDYYRILVKRGSPEINPWGFLNPLGPTVWLGTMLGMLVLSLLLSVGVVSLVKLRDGPQDKWTTARLVLNQFWDQFATVCQQNLIYIYDAVATRMMVGMWLLGVMVIMKSFSSALTSLLAVRNIPVRIDYLRDLVDDRSFQLVFETSTALTATMEQATSGIYQELRGVAARGRVNFLKASDLFDVAFSSVREGGVALLVEDATIRKIISDDFSLKGTCDYYIGKESYYPLIFCIVGVPGLPIMPAINYRIQSLVEHDLYSEWVANLLPNATSCLRAPSSITVNEPYTMEGLWGIFVVLGVGLSISALVFVVEVVIHRKGFGKGPGLPAPKIDREQIRSTQAPSRAVATAESVASVHPDETQEFTEVTWSRVADDRQQILSDETAT
ncbi:glutamate receptor U1-like [Penaeus chinensis]|uniref:glutamate receptor U1-like n=1 Tax=Penaeus chinensis TaxID=139456 RepID=UPI001FB6DAC3|nr:glutamate receptor U1-like [Penaeus chinensis]